MACKKKNSSRIAVVRGDSAYVSFTITDAAGNPFPFVVGEDRIRCQVRDKVNDGDLLFEGEVISEERTAGGKTEMTHVWHIRPTDTRDADMTKRYVYDIEVELSNGDVFTFIKASPFLILDEVTLPEE